MRQNDCRQMRRRAYEPTDSEILYRNPDNSVGDLAAMNRTTIQPYRKDVRMIVQDPYSALNPRVTLLEVISEALRVIGTRLRARNAR